MPKIRTCKLCSRPRTANGYCALHQACAPTEPRQDNKAWRSRRGRKLRDAYLAEHPYCADHLRIYGQPVPAMEVHHVQPMLDRPDLALDDTNLIALCHDCHNARHGKGIGGAKSYSPQPETFATP